MPATSPPTSEPRRRGRPCSANPRRDRLSLAVDVLAALAGLPPTPAVVELAAAVGWPAAKLDPVLDAMGRSGLVERWQDPDHPGRVRVMLSSRALARLGLVLAPRGDRWNPDRPAASGQLKRSPQSVDHTAAAVIVAKSARITEKL